MVIPGTPNTPDLQLQSSADILCTACSSDDKAGLQKDAVGSGGCVGGYQWRSGVQPEASLSFHNSFSASRCVVSEMSTWKAAAHD